MEAIKRKLTTVGVSDPRPETYLAKLFHKPRYDLILKMVKEKIGNNMGIVLDAGCGTGALFEWLLKGGISFNMYVGCDIDLGRLKCSGRGFEKVVCDISHLPFIDNSIDVIICSEVLEHIKNPYIAFRELLRVSRRWVLVTFPNERIKNALGFKYPEHLSEPSLPVILGMAMRKGCSLALYMRLYFVFPPSILDKIIPYNPKRLKLIETIFGAISRLLRVACLIKTEVLLFQKLSEIKRKEGRGT